MILRNTWFAFALLVSAVSGVRAAPPPHTVNSTGDTTDGVCDVSHCTLREAMAAALLDGGSVTFSSLFDVPQTINLTAVLPDISSSMTITGPGADRLTVRRASGGDYRIFTIIEAHSASISGLTISNGKSGFGAGILAHGTLTLANAAVTENQTTGGGGGGIYSDGPGIQISGSTFSGNQAGEGAGVYVYRYTNANPALAVLTNTTVSANTGPGITIVSDPSGPVSLYVKNCTVAENSGQGIVTTAAGSAATSQLSNTVFDNNALGSLAVNGFDASVLSTGGNIASDDASGLLPDAGDLTSQSLHLSPLGKYGGRTQTQPPQIGSPAINYGQTQAIGTDQRGVPRPQGSAFDSGAVELRSLVVTTNADPGDGACDASCTLRDAITAANADGTGVDDISFSAAMSGFAQTIALTSALPAMTSSLNIFGTGADQLTVRRSTGGSYRIFQIEPGASVALDGMTIANGASDFGGGLRNQGTLTIRDVAVSGNTASLAGGGILSAGEALYVERSTISGNQSAGTSGGIGIQSGAADISNTTISGNAAAGVGGAIRMISYGPAAANLALGNVTIAGNTASAEGGIGAGDYGGPAIIRLRNTLIAGNTSPNLVTGGANAAIVSEGNNLSSDNGAGFLIGPGDLTSQSARLSALGNYGGTTPTQPPQIGSPAINAGSASSATDQRGVPRPQGGAVDIGAVELRPLIVTSAADPGDGVCDASCTLRDAMTAANADGAGVDDISFSAAAFASAQTINLAGALPEISTSMVISGPGADLLDLHRNLGGNYRILKINSGASASISGLSISNGAGVQNGGGISNLGDLTLANCAVRANAATAYGGGVFNKGRMEIINSTINNNTASGGAGVFTSTDAGVSETVTASLINTTISGNAATGGGGAIANVNFGGSGSNLALLNCTLTGNSHAASASLDTSGQGGSAITSLKNTLVANNSLPNLGEGSGAVVISDGNNLASDDGSGLLITLGDQINQQPLLSALGNHGGHTQTQVPQFGSPAIDAGSDSGAPATDQRGILRPQGIKVDIGAVEWSDNIFGNGFETP